MTKYEKLIELANRMGSTKLCLDSTMVCRYRGVGLEQIEWNKKYNELLAEFLAELKTLTGDTDEVC